MTALKTTAQSVVLDIQRLLSESYGSGFTIFKELVQNADDVGASKLLLAGHEGYPSAENALLRAPGIFVANDGTVSSSNWEALQLASGGGKAGEEHAVGRFGLGQKALYHLCDAYVVFARLDGAPTPTTMVLNPFENIAQADVAFEWKDLSAADNALLTQWADARDFGQGLVLYIPLRTPALRPCAGHDFSLTKAQWTPSEALRDIVDSEQLHVTLSCLRHLQQIAIECPGERPWNFLAGPGFRRLAGPGKAAQAVMQPEIDGTFSIDGQTAQVHGWQTHNPNGRAAALRKLDDWPLIWELGGQVKESKATPHGGAIVCRHPAIAGAGAGARLRIWQAVYLPLGDPTNVRTERNRVLLAEAPLSGSDHVEIIVHGDFFVSSDRVDIRRDISIETRWNEALLAEAALPCVLDAITRAIAAMPADKDRVELLRTLAQTAWWPGEAQNICGDRVLARVRDKANATWRITSATGLRPLPEGETTRPRRLAAAWSKFDDWCQSNDFTLAYGTTLGSAAPTWADHELSELITGFSPTAFSDKDAATTLADILDEASPGPLARAALAEGLRQAVAAEAKLAPFAQIKRLTRHLPTERLLVLQRSVTEPALLARLAGLEHTLCVREDWMAEELAATVRRLNRDEAVAMLVLLEPILTHPGRQADQALTVINLIMLRGPGFAELARDQVAQALKVIPVVSLDNGATILLSPNRIHELVQEGQLFQHGPKMHLEGLASAIAEPVIYQARQNFPLPADMALASGNSEKDKCRIVGQVRRFGPIEARIALLEDLRKLLDAQALRRIVSGEPDLPKTAVLARIKGLDAALLPVVQRLASADENTRLLDPRIADVVNPQKAREAEIEDRDNTWLGEQLARRHAFVEPFNDGQAIALLKSGIANDVLVKLALHKAMGATGLYRAATLLRGRLDAVPAAMRSLVQIVDPWPDREAEAVQRQLIAAWGPERQIELALESATPHTFADEITQALAEVGKLEDHLVTQLRQMHWLPVGKDGTAPCDVRDLLPCAREFYAQKTGNPAPVARGDLPEAIVQGLARHEMLDDRLASYKTTLREMAEIGVSGLVVDPLQHQDDLRKLAHAKSVLGDGIWMLVASAMRAFPEAESLRQALIGIDFEQPDIDEIIDQLNALAALANNDGQVGDAARRLYVPAFEARKEQLLKGTGFLAPDLLAPSEAGTFARADQLGLQAAGIASTSRLDPALKFDLPEGFVAPAPLSREQVRNVDAVIGELLEPFVLFQELYPAVLMVLAMLGRSPAIKKVAARFAGVTPFERICEDLDEAAQKTLSVGDSITGQLSRITFTVQQVENGQAPVLSAAGTLCAVQAMAGSELLYDCIKVGRHLGPQGEATEWRLTVAPVQLADLEEATRYLRNFVYRLDAPLRMTMQNQRHALGHLFNGYLASDQATLEEAIADIRDGLAERIKKLTRSPYLRAALERYDDDSRRRGQNEGERRATAKEQLWKAIREPGAADELLNAVREKMNRRNYDASRALFELFQNAVDAARQGSGESDVRVEAQRDETGQICNLRFIHWGRPINHPGPNAPLRFARDLDNMLDMDSSEKEGMHGRHGLGFKTVHMLSNDARVASGRLRFRILGGMIPEPWEEGRALQQIHDRKLAFSTVIDLPVPPELAEGAGMAWDTFNLVAPFLPVTAPEIGQIILCDGGDLSSGETKPQDIGPGLAMVDYGRGRRALRLDLDSGYRMFVQIVEGMPVAFPNSWSRLWNLVPMDGEVVHAAWLLNGPFEMDQGRRSLHGKANDKVEEFRKRGGPLGDRLTTLYEGWAEVAAAAGLLPEGRDTFFDRLIDLMYPDVAADLTAALHVLEGRSSGRPTSGRGLTTLLAQCPVIPLASGGRACVGDVDSVYEHSLSDPVILQRVSTWLGEFGLGTNAVDTKWASRLTELGFTRPVSCDLGVLAERLFLTPDVSPSQAALLGGVFNPSARQDWPVEERKRVDRAIRAVRLKSEDGKFVSSTQLLFPQDARETQEGQVERLRAGFAPTSGRLHADYSRDAVEFAQLVRASAGYVPPATMKYWLDTASGDARRELAALQYLANRPNEIGSIPWLQSAEAARALSAFAKLSPAEQRVLIAWLGDDGGSDLIPPYVPFFEPNRPPPEDILAGVVEWWDENREDLVSRYEQATYGDLCDPELMREDDDEAWFTLLSLGSFQTLGRIKPEHSRRFVERGRTEKWWNELAHVDDDDPELQGYVARLIAWSEPDAPEDYLMWRRCLGDMCMIARHLDTYRSIFKKLPAIIRQEGGKVALSSLLRPSSDAHVGRMNLEGAPIARSLGMGANWIVRELARREIYTGEEAQIVQPFAWSTRLRIRSFVEEIGLGAIESGMDTGRKLHRRVTASLDDPMPFGIDGDLPLELINTRPYPPARSELLTPIVPDNDLEGLSAYA
ncbi:hypothetical protein CDQ92_10655 [Sphingopyxis bauzanensis]|uniref:Sacsin/Nov domain-containing protein n=1 Tax=Sphingopyxis bauzanensis TaxID=651663 RepID=A0A246JWQ0_9SPHN|nr:ATP-binding protein [Sphingopyxis bauzanensis]OWQ97468.1 hypothetical protein CDQ92_10655 [Sphingopyxis bauzanensis]GGJ36214.1 hypothetical protein GCM10011393_03290 [Sphingopyxis bauzanensis]